MKIGQMVTETAKEKQMIILTNSPEELELLVSSLIQNFEEITATLTIKFKVGDLLLIL